MVSVARIVPATRRRPAPLHYHVLLSSILQLRFGQMAKVLLLTCWSVTIILGVPQHIGWIWWLLPLRSVPVFISAFIVLLIRKQNLHVKALTYPNLASELVGQLVSKQAIGTIALYQLSSAIFFWFVTRHMSDMTFTVPAVNKYEMPRLNERWVFFHVYSAYVAFVYAILHLVFDYDLVRFPLTRLTVSARARIRARSKDVCLLALVYAVAITLSFPIVYLVFRGIIWANAVALARYVTRLNRSTEYTGFPIGFVSLLATLLATILLLGLWEFTNTVFSIYMSIGPLHRRQPLSTKSKNANATLITGLDATSRPYTQIIAFQELLYVSVNSKERRVSIYGDVESDLTTWTEIRNACFRACAPVAMGIQKKSKPIGEPVAAVAPKPEEQPPRMTAAQLSVKTDNIFADGATQRKKGSRASATRLVDGLQDKDAQWSFEVLGVLGGLRKRLHDTIQQSTKTLSSLADTPFGKPFRYTLKRQTTAHIPNVVLINCAILSLGYLVTHSIDEDPYGTIQRDIPLVLGGLDELLTIITEYAAHPPIHWTDVDELKAPSHTKALRRAEEIIDVAEAAFEMIVLRFANYLDELDLSEPVRRRAQSMQAAAEAEATAVTEHRVKKRPPPE